MKTGNAVTAGTPRRWTWQGKQYRQSAKTRSWEGAERARRELELKYEDAHSGKTNEAETPATVEEAINAFLAEKRGGQAAVGTLAKYKLTLSRLQEFCDRQNLSFIREVRLEHLSSWREEWSKYYSSKFALRNNQGRIRHFFRYAQNAGMINQNPAMRGQAQGRILRLRSPQSKAEEKTSLTHYHGDVPHQIESGR